MDQYIEDKRSKWIAILYTVLIHGILGFLLYWAHTYQFEKKEKKEYGMEVTYGTDALGMYIHEIPIETIKQEDIAPLISEIEHEKAEEDVILKEKEKQQKATEKKETKKTEEQNTKTKDKNTTQNENPTQEKKQGTDQQQGNKGKEMGTDVKNKYTSPGGMGTSLELTGWDWEAAPKVRDLSNESGKIVFQILVDDKGQVISITTLESTVSPSVEKLYEREVNKTRFYPTKENTSPAPVSKGKISFLIRTK